MADIFQEVDEEVRREQLKKLWERYGNYIVAAASRRRRRSAAGAATSGGRPRRRPKSGAAFEQAVTLADAGKHEEAEAAFAKLATDGTAGYRVLARLREAAELAQTDPKARRQSL